jgi:methionine-rich copper-binding protein CopC
MAGAEAHAFLDHAQPAVGSSTKASPELKLWFSENIKPAFSKVEVRAANGAEIKAGPLRVDQAQGSLVHVPLPGLKPGIYRVHWQVISVDSHVTSGNFHFTVTP